MIIFLLVIVLESCAGQQKSTDKVSNKQVGQWDHFEATVTNTEDYTNPYRDVTLKVTYTRPDGSTVDFWGFYDDGDTWRIRFMPGQIGTWNYEATFSDGTPGASGSFEVISSDIPGMISKDETNPLWFGFKGGEHVLIRSFHVGDRFFAENWDASKRVAFLDWAEAQGYNMLSIGSHYLNRDAEGRGRGWDTPDLWPLDAAEYQKMETILEDLAKRHIMVYPFAGFFGRATDFPEEEVDQRSYIRYTLARIGPYWNILLNVGGPEPSLDDREYLSMEAIHRLGVAIDGLDVFDHLLSVHNRPGNNEFADALWLSYAILQGPKTTDLNALSDGLLTNHPLDAPLYAQETLWTGNVYHIRSLGGRDYSDDELRKNAFVINMSATALNFADNHGNSSSGFSGTLELSDRDQERHDIVARVWDFFETIPFYRMSPCQDLVTNGFCLADEGQQYLVYLPSGGTVDVDVTDGHYEAEWINAKNTSDRRSGGETKYGQDLAAPVDGDDWLLYLVRSDVQASEEASTPKDSSYLRRNEAPPYNANFSER